MWEFFKQVDFKIIDEKNKKVNWNIYYYVYSQKIQGKLHSYHEMNMKYYKVRDEKALYREAASYYINGFKLNEFLYNNFWQHMWIIRIIQKLLLQ